MALAVFNLQINMLGGCFCMEWDNFAIGLEMCFATPATDFIGKME